VSAFGNISARGYLNFNRSLPMVRLPELDVRLEIRAVRHTGRGSYVERSYRVYPHARGKTAQGVCAECGGIWQRPRAHLKGEGPYCCSLVCHNRWLGHRQRGSRNPHPKARTDAWFACDFCYKLIRLPRSVAARSSLHFCSKKCKDEYQRRDARGDQASAWRGGEVTRGNGYVGVCVEHGGAGKRTRYRMKHRIVIEAATGRPFPSGFVTHHRNGDPSDNRLENLAVLRQGDHARLHRWSINDPRRKSLRMLIVRKGKLVEVPAC